MEKDPTQDLPANPALILESNGVNPDMDVAGFTKRERACIDLLIPDSGLLWLDELIKERERRNIVVAMAAAIVSNRTDPGEGYVSKTATDFATAILYRLS